MTHIRICALRFRSQLASLLSEISALAKSTAPLSSPIRHFTSAGTSQLSSLPLAPIQSQTSANSKYPSISFRVL